MSDVRPEPQDLDVEEHKRLRGRTWPRNDCPTLLAGPCIYPRCECPPLPPGSPEVYEPHQVTVSERIMQGEPVQPADGPGISSDEFRDDQEPGLFAPRRDGE